MNTELVKSQIREKKWKKIVDEYPQSGMNVEDYCRSKNVSKSCFYKWLHKFREQKLKEAGIDERTFELPSVVEVNNMIPAIRETPKIRINARGITVEVDDGVGSEILASLVRALL